MTVNDNIIPAEGWGRFFKNLVKISAKAGKKNKLPMTSKILGEHQIQVQKLVVPR